MQLLNVKAIVAAFDMEKVLVGAFTFSVIVLCNLRLRGPSFPALLQGGLGGLADDGDV